MARDRKWFRLLIVLALVASLGFVGCAGDDGDDGSDGVDGAPGAEGPAGPAGPTGPEGPAGAPGEDAGDVTASARHADPLAGSIAIQNLVIDESESIKIAFEVQEDGETGSGNYDLSRIFRMYFDADAGDYTIERIFDTSRSTGATTILDGCTVNGTAGDGDPETDDGLPADHAETDRSIARYVFVIGGCDQPAVNSRYFVRLQGDDIPRVNAVGDYPAAPDLPPTTLEGLENPPEGRLLVFSETCQACHGQNAPGLHNANPFDPDLCAVCHDGQYNETLTAVRFGELAHGIHRSHHFETYDENGDPIPGFEFEGEVFEVTFPTNMNNCSICHGTGAALEYVQAQVVTWDLCMTCHQDFDGFGDTDFGGLSHDAFTEDTDCLACHGDTGQNLTDLDTVAEFHNGFLNDAGHCQQLIWDGEDVSVAEGAKMDLEITGVAIAGDQMSVTWTATYDGVPVDPCNDDIDAGPVFDGDDAGNLSLLRAYFVGDDPLNAGLDRNAGQPFSTNLSTDNTSCADNVATSTITLDASEVSSTATRARVGLQGTPRINPISSGLIPDLVILNADEDDDECTDGTITIRAKSPTYDFDKATGAQATQRRPIVDTLLCLKCHVGTLYQHGGNRIDNVDLCVMCHNAAANDKYVRVDYGVDASEAYDGKVGESFSIKNLAHSVHSAGVNERLFVIYRGRGIYAWDALEQVEDIPNWPGAGSGLPVFGSDDGTGAPRTQTHNFHAPTYPRFLSDCSACHIPGTETAPNPFMAMAETVDPGDAADWGDQTDDVLQGPYAASCLPCHLMGDPVDQVGIRAHVNQNGFAPTAFPNGRQAVINLEDGALEACGVCHEHHE